MPDSVSNVASGVRLHMWQDLISKLSPVSASFVPIAMGVVLGVVARDRLDRSALTRAAKLCENASLKFFLPLFVIESVSNSRPSYDLVLAFVVGFLLPLAALGGMRLYKSVFAETRFVTPRFDDLRFLASTYGGGNRGTALFVLLFADSVHFKDYLKWFSLVDLGNFACLLLVVSMLLVPQYGSLSSDNRSLLAKLLDNYAVVTICVVALYFSLQHFWPSVASVLAVTRHERRFVFSLLVFLAIVLRFERGALGDFFIDLLAFFSARVFAGLCIMTLLFPFLPEVHPIYLSVIILVMMPPSTFLPSMIGQTNASNETLSYVNGFSGATNVLYLGLIAAAAVVAISRLVD